MLEKPTWASWSASGQPFPLRTTNVWRRMKNQQMNSDLLEFVWRFWCLSCRVEQSGAKETFSISALTRLSKLSAISSDHGVIMQQKLRQFPTNLHCKTSELPRSALLNVRKLAERVVSEIYRWTVSASQVIAPKRCTFSVNLVETFPPR